MLFVILPRLGRGVRGVSGRESLTYNTLNYENKMYFFKKCKHLICFTHSYRVPHRRDSR